MNFSEQAAQLRIEMDDAKEEYLAAKKVFHQLNTLLKDIGYAPTGDGTFTFTRLQAADRQLQAAFEKYVGAMQRLNDLIQGNKPPE